MSDESKTIPGKPAAIIGEGLFLLNLLFPVLPLIPLAILNMKQRSTSNQYLRAHLKYPLVAALISTSLFLLGCLYIVLSGGYTSISIELIVVLEAYTLLVVIPLLIPGLIGLIKAMSGEIYRYPLIRKWVSI